MTRETQNKFAKLLLEWVIKPIIPAALVAIFVFTSQTSSSIQVSASEVKTLKENQTEFRNQIEYLNNGLDSKTDALTNTREHSEIKTELNNKATKADVEALGKSIQKIDDRTYQILILLQKK